MQIAALSPSKQVLHSKKKDGWGFGFLPQGPKTQKRRRAARQRDTSQELSGPAISKATSWRDSLSRRSKISTNTTLPKTRRKLKERNNMTVYFLFLFLLNFCTEVSRSPPICKNKFLALSRRFSALLFVRMPRTGFP